MEHSDLFLKTRGICCGHFGEILQGQFNFGYTRYTRGLVSLKVPTLMSHVEIEKISGDGEIIIPSNKLKTKLTAINYLKRYKSVRSFNLKINLDSNIPEGKGMGSSTADIMATIRALDKLVGIKTTFQERIDLLLKVEKACDSTVLENFEGLFAQREGKIIHSFSNSLPPISILGVDLMPDENVITDKLPLPAYSLNEINDFNELFWKLNEAVYRKDVLGIANVATESALLNQKFYPKKNFDLFLEFAKEYSSLGVIISHSGTIAGLIYDKSLEQNLMTEMHTELARIDIKPLGMFCTTGEQ